jgi:hypothetical protein
MKNELSIPDEIITNKIYLIRDQKVMLDKDLAKLYGVATKQLKRQVRRNIERFPVSFMFEITKQENENLRSQNGTLKHGSHSKYLPFVFTEHGILMLSSTLNSPLAIRMSLHIIETFVQLRKFAMNYEEISNKIHQMEAQNQKQFGEIFKILERLLVNPKEKPRPQIGFKKG